MEDMDTDVRVLTWYMKILCASDGLITNSMLC